jgi:DNA-directed RNA polymerase subunit RPC12/RpoP
MDRNTTMVIAKCTKCGWSFMAARDRLEITDAGFRCGRCLENITLTTIDKSFTNLVD